MTFLAEVWRGLFAANPKPGEVFVFADDCQFDEFRVTVTRVERGWIEYMDSNGGKLSRRRYWFHVCYRRSEVKRG